MKKCKYHCDYGDGENCHYEGENGCIYIKGRRLTDAESMGMLFDDTPKIEWKTMYMNTKVDMVEVVRCKDCAFRYTNKCVLHDQAFPVNKPNDWFCADGEMKE